MFFKLINNKKNYGVIAGSFGMFTNFLLGVVKFVVGYFCNSISVMVDAYNNISDCVSSLLAIIGFKLSLKKPDLLHPFGYGRYEYLSSFVISIFMLIMGMTFCKESILKIFNVESININIYVFYILFFSIFVKFLQFILYFSFYKKIKSNTLKISAMDARNDIICTFIILISMYIYKLFGLNIDGHLGLVVSLFVIFSSIKMIIEVTDQIIGCTDLKKIEFIKNILLSYEIVSDCSNVFIHNYGINCNFVNVSLKINMKEDIKKILILLNNIKNDFKNKYNLNIIIEIENNA